MDKNRCVKCQDLTPSRVVFFLLILFAGLISQISAVYAATQFVITTPPFTTTKDNPSPSIVVEARDESGVLDPTFNETADLLSSSGGGVFSADRILWSDITSITFTGGYALFYYRDSNAGTPDITVSRSGLNPGTQTVNVVEPSANESTSFISASPDLIDADGLSTCTVILTIRDTYGFPVASKYATLQTTRGDSDIIGPVNPQLTDINGQCFWSISSGYEGWDTITALCDGNIITNDIDFCQATGIWYLDMDLNDASGNGFNGSLQDGGSFPPPLWVEGKFGSCIQFDGVDDYIDIPFGIDSLLDLGRTGESYSIECWFKSSDIPSQDVCFFTSAVNNPDVFNFTQTAGGKVKFSLFDGTNTPFVESAGNITDGLWHHLVGIRRAENTTIELWVDGVLEGTDADTTQNTPLNGCSMNVQIGGDPEYGTYFKGAIDEPKIYRFALSPQQISSNYTRKTSTNIYFRSPPPPSFALRFATPPFSTTVDNPSCGIIVEAWNEGESKIYPINDTVSLEASSLTGKFSVDRINWQDTSVVTLVQGRKFFYYRDSQVSGPEGVTITAYRCGLEPAVQTGTIQLPGVNADASYIIVNSLVTVDGANPCTVSVVVQDTYGFPVSGVQVTLFSSRGYPGDIIIQPGLTDANGQCTGSILYRTSGTDSITALCEGVIVTRGVDLYKAEGIWHFDRDTKDYSGKNYDAINYGGMWSGDARFGSALRFEGGENGIISYAECDSSPVLNTATVEAWTKVLNYPSSNSSMILGKLQGRMGPWLFSVWSASNNNLGALEVRNASDYLIFSQPLPLNTWVHLVGIYNSGGTSRVYLNGEEKGNKTFPQIEDDGSIKLRFSNNISSSDTFGGAFTGIVDEVKIYNRILSPEEISALYNKVCRLTLVPASIAFISGPFHTTRNNPSVPVIIEIQDAESQRMNSFSETVVLQSSSPGGRFSVSSTSWQDTTFIYCVAGRAIFYYKDSETGSPVITVSREGFIPDTQCEIIEEPLPSETCSYLEVKPVSMPGNGIDTGTITVTLVDTYGYPVAGKQVIILSSRGASDTITQPPANSDSNGQATGTICTSYMGGATIYALSDGCTISGNLVFNPSFEQADSFWDMGFATIDNEIRYAGSRSAKLSAAGANIEGAKSADFIPVSNKPFFVYRISAYLKANVSSGTYCLSIYFYSDTDAYLGFSDAGGLGTSSSWKYFSRTCGSTGSGADILFPENCAKVKICAGRWWSEAGTPAGEGWTDAIRFTRIPDLYFSGPTVLQILTPPRTALVGTATDSIVVQAQFENGQRVFGFNSPCTFTSSSSTGRFAPSSYGPWSSTNRIVVNFVDGETFVYYRDSKVGSPSITVSCEGMPDTSQIQNITLASFSNTTSYMLISRSSCPADGITPCTIVVVACDIYRNPFPGKTITLQTTNPAGFDTITYPYGQITDQNGACTITLVSTLIGPDTPQATVSGEPGAITRVEFKDIAAGIWNFDEGADTVAYDISGNNNTGILQFGMGWAPGRYGQALYSDGNSRALEIPHSTSLNETMQLTVEAWVYPQNASKQYNRVIGKGWYPADIQGSYLLYVADNKATFGIYHGISSIVSGGTINNNQWYHLAGTFIFDGTNDTIALYVNGDRVSVSPSPTHPHPGPLGNTQPVIVSSGNNIDPTCENCFVGLIDEVRIYNRVLSPAEIKANYLGKAKPINFYSAMRLAFVTPPRTMQINTPSDSIVIQVQRPDGNKVVEFNGTASISSSSAGGRFCATRTGGTWVSQLTLRFVNGETFVYYKDTRSGFPVITVSGANLVETSQVQIVEPGPFSNTASYILASSHILFADGISPCTITVVVNDICRSPIKDKTVVIYTTNGNSDTILYPNGQTTDINGVCTAVLFSTVAGRDTVVAVVSGEANTITNILFRDCPGIWNFEEGSGAIITDLSLNGNNGTLSGSPEWRDGKYGYCLYFGGGDSVVSIPHSQSLNIGKAGQSYSIEFWFNSSSPPPAGDSHFFSKWDFPYPFSVVYYANGNVGFRLYDGTSNPEARSTLNLVDGTWHHIVCVRDASSKKMKMYVDGNLNAEVADSTGGDINNNAPVLIGKIAGANFNGMIDEARIYNYAIEDEEAYARFKGRSVPLTLIGASKLVITTPPRSMSVNTPSESICVQAQWNDGSPATGYNEDCIFTSSFSTGRFCATQTGETWVPTIAIRMVNGEARVYYKDTKSGSPVITVSSTILSETSQVQSVSPGSFSSTSSYLIISNSAVPSNGISSSTITVLVTDYYHNPLSGKTVILRTANPGGYDTITYPFGQITDTNGYCTAVLVSTKLGRDTISAVVSGEPGTITYTYVQDISIAIWNFEEGAGTLTRDISGHGNIGILYGNPPYVSGKFGYALSFEGPGGYAGVPHNTGIDIGKPGKSYSIGFWFKSSNIPSGDAHFFTKTYWQNYPVSMVQDSAGRVQFRIWDGAANPVAISTNNLTDGKWHHIVAVRDADAKKILIYVDGSLNQQVVDSTTKDMSNTAPLTVGAGGGEDFSGVLDEVHIYNRALNASEVKAVYENTPYAINFTASNLFLVSSPFKVKAGATSPLITLIAGSLSGETDTSFANTVALTSSSESRSFSIDGENWSEPGKDRDILLSYGKGTFYYRDYRSGDVTITASRQDLGVEPAMQLEKISAATLGIVSPEFTISSTDSAPLKAVAFTYSGDTDITFNEAAVLLSSSPLGRFSLTSSPWKDTTVIEFSAGSAEFWYRDRRGGNPSIAVTQPELELYALQSNTITMPVITLFKKMKNLRTNTEDTIVSVFAGDTLEYTVVLTNAGLETALNLVITDTEAFDSRVFTPITFISMDTAQLDTCAYTTDPAYINWIPGIPPAESDDVKGLRWKINTLGIKESRTFIFRVRVR